MEAQKEGGTQTFHLVRTSHCMSSELDLLQVNGYKMILMEMWMGVKIQENWFKENFEWMSFTSS